MLVLLLLLLLPLPSPVAVVLLVVIPEGGLLFAFACQPRTLKKRHLDRSGGQLHRPPQVERSLYLCRCLFLPLLFFPLSVFAVILSEAKDPDTISQSIPLAPFHPEPIARALPSLPPPHPQLPADP